MNTLVISIYSIPNGLAPTVRILAYCRGLSSNSCGVDIIVPFPTDEYSTVNQLSNSGSINGILYHFPSGRYKSKYKLIRGLAYYSRSRMVMGYYRSIRWILSNLSQKKFDNIIISSDSISALFIYSNLAHYLGIPSIFIFDEFPVPIRHKLKNQIPTWKRILYMMVLSRIHAYVSISEGLSNFYNSIRPKPTHVMPLIVDVDRFILKQSGCGNQEKYICYMGNMELAKDDVLTIISAFELISDKFPNIKLYLFGDPNHKDRLKILGSIEKLRLRDRVIFQGKVQNSMVPKILANALILVSAQPNTKRASGGFPTKLGEYLASGVPSILTEVGENSRIVKHERHCFFFEPGDSNMLAEQLKKILMDYENALKIAEYGRNEIITNYSHLVVGKELMLFLKSLGYN